MEKRHQVVIVGGGPVGVALAVELGLRGISCALVERRHDTAADPQGAEPHRSARSSTSISGASPMSCAPSRFLPRGLSDRRNHRLQDPDERVLVRAAAARDRPPLLFPGQRSAAAILHGRRAAPQDGRAFPTSRPRSAGRRRRSSRTTAACASPSPREGGAARQVLEADYVVGCDGGHSTVREQIGIARGGADFDQLMVLAVFRSRELHEGLKRFPERSTYRAMHPDLKGYWQFFGRIDVGEGLFFHAPVPADTTRDNYDFHGLIQKAAGFHFACEFDHVGFWDLRVAVAEKLPGRPRVHRRRCRAQPSALWRLRPQQRARGRRPISAGSSPPGWKAGAATRLLRSYGEERRPIFQETGEDFIAGAHQDRPRISWRATARSATARSSSAPGRSSRATLGNRVHDLRAELRRLVGGLRPARRRLQRPRHAHVQGARRPSPAAAAAVVRTQRVRGAGPGLHAARLRCRATARSTRFRRGGEIAGRAAEGGPRHACDGARRPTRRASSWCGRINTWSGPATAPPDDAGKLLRRVTGRA